MALSSTRSNTNTKKNKWKRASLAGVLACVLTSVSDVALCVWSTLALRSVSDVVLCV